MYANVAASGAKLFEQVAADNALYFNHAQRKGFVASLGAHSKGGEGKGLDFPPGGAADGVDVALDRPGQREVRHAENALDAPDSFLGRRRYPQLDDQAIARTVDAFHAQAVERPAQGDPQLA